MADEQLNQQVSMQDRDGVEQYSEVDYTEVDSLDQTLATSSDTCTSASSTTPTGLPENRLRFAELEIAHAHRIIRERDTDLAAANHKLEELSGLLQAKELSLALQRAKIAKLMAENERIGAEREELANLERRLIHLSPNSHAALAELLAWRQFGQERLGTCFESADRQLAQLWKYAQEMGSPGHRMVRFIGKTMGRTWVGRKCNAALSLGYALLKSR